MAISLNSLQEGSSVLLEVASCAWTDRRDWTRFVIQMPYALGVLIEKKNAEPSLGQHVNMSKGQSTAVDHRSQLPTSKLATREKREHHNRRVDFVLPCLALKNNQTNMQIRLLSNTLDQRYHKHRNTNTILLLLLLLNDVAWSSSWTWTWSCSFLSIRRVVVVVIVVVLEFEFEFVQSNWIHVGICREECCHFATRTTCTSKTARIGTTTKYK